MFFYIYIDFIILYLLLLGEFNNNILEKISRYGITFIFFAVAGLSYKIHNDMYVYQYIYDHIYTTTSSIFINIEPGFYFINYLGGIFSSFPLFKLIVYVVNTLLIYKGTQKLVTKKELTLVLALLYFMASFYMLYATTFRQAIAISIFIYSLQYLKDNKYLKYYICIFIAISFHISALILLIIPLVFKWYKSSMYKDLSILFISIALGYLSFIKDFISFLTDMLSNYIPQLQHYTENLFATTTSFSLYSLFIAILSLLTIILFNTKKIPPSKKERFIYVGFIIFFVLFFTGTQMTILYRVLLYFYIFFTFSLLLSFKQIRKNYIYFIIKYILIAIIIIKLNIVEIHKKFLIDHKYIPYHSSIELIFYDIPYEETAQHEHMFSRFSSEHANFEN